MTDDTLRAGATEALGRFITGFRRDRLNDDQRRIAQLCMLDGAAVALAGEHEPVARIVRGMVTAEGGVPEAFVFGLGHHLPARAAALANGTAMHALDYDDTHFDHIGHSTVAILPAVLALGEKLGASGAEVLDAFVIGIETACRVGVYFGPGHYQSGFHQTATAGAFGAAAAAARLVGLPQDACRHAIGIVSTRASGLKSQFGTMGKPLHAGLAAANGVEAATLAGLGFVSNPQGLEGLQGFAETHAGGGRVKPDAFDGLGEAFRFDRVQFKYHACCHGTHAPIEALAAIVRDKKIEPEAVESVTLKVHPRWLRVCDIKEPATGLEAKFSYTQTSAMVLAARDTASLASFDDAACSDRQLAALRDRVIVETDDGLGDTEARVNLLTRNGRRISSHADLSRPTPVAETEARLKAKAAALIGADAAARLAACVGGMAEDAAFGLPALLAGLSKH
ncbi:MmgE/PrpD family protein [Stappia sp. F7233]|uniref:MmgE/PrpD family protein n=1 Tax=Stappia albiluteola TaxID=2758565 RepID=A0A839AID6_9HYPH|nr:MmgE/PrpD family protein [Stappia albiluteola]MBA5778279.1 MmgE/PrpD family protein [Stappia albiluteola]